MDPALHRLVTSGVRVVVVALIARFGFEATESQVNELVAWGVVGVGIAGSLAWSWVEEKRKGAIK